MSLAVRSPRRSALGVEWCEDFSRGRLGVRKNQGQIVEAAPNVVEINGRWARFPGSTAAFIQYPHLIVTGRTEITFGCWVEDVALADGTIMGQISSAAWPTNVEYQLYVLAAGTFGVSIRRSGTTSSLSGGAFAGRSFLVARWLSGSPLETFLNGLQTNATGNLGGTMDDSDQPLIIGRRASVEWPLDGSVSEPFVDFRAWSDTEILGYYNRSLFH